MDFQDRIKSFYRVSERENFEKWKAHIYGNKVVVKPGAFWPIVSGFVSGMVFILAFIGVTDGHLNDEWPTILLDFVICVVIFFFAFDRLWSKIHVHEDYLEDHISELQKENEELRQRLGGSQ